MKSITSILFVFLCMASAGYASNETGSQLPADVAKFKERRDLCDHFRGEEPYDEERRKFLLESLDKYCKGSDRELASLKEKYKKNPDILGVLGGFEEKIEASSF